MRGAWVTLATTDDYALGALVLARSIKITETTNDLVVLVGQGVSEARRRELRDEFTLLEPVEVRRSRPEYRDRPELGVTLTKISAWRLVQYDKCVFLDADTLMLQNCDNLFLWDEFSAAPDIGWPDCFNTGVFVFQPSLTTFANLERFFAEKGSFDGADQGLLNSYFSDWAMRPERRLPFVYNAAFSTVYFYVPAFRKFERDLKILHFLGSLKPWHVLYDKTYKRLVQVPEELRHALKYLEYWWRLADRSKQDEPNEEPEPQSTTKVELEPHFAREEPQHVCSSSNEEINAVSVAEDTPQPEPEPEPEPCYEAWQTGQMDFMGIDSFANIRARLDSTVSRKDNQ